MMLKSTMNSSTPATFNMALLFENVKHSKTECAKMMSFLKNKNIRDYRIGADESLNKGSSFCDLSFDLMHHLFDSINFHQLFNESDEDIVLTWKVNVYNDVVGHLKYDLMEAGRNASIKSNNEYVPKLRSYIPHLIKRSIELHKHSDEFGTVEEGVENFWYIVDHYIFTNKVKHELHKLRHSIANADGTYYD